MPLLEDIFDESYIDPEVEDYINFMDADEQESTGFLTKKRINEHFEEGRGDAEFIHGIP